MSEIDRVIGGLEKLSAIAQLRDKVREATNAKRDRCGGCEHWMKSRSCPRERNVGGMSRGPSCDAPACSSFSITQREIEGRDRRANEAVAFAKRNGLPAPTYLLSPTNPPALSE